MFLRAVRLIGLCAVLVCGVGVPVGGCDEIGGALYLLEGPPEREAVFEFDPRRSAVVLVDDRRGAMPRRSLLRSIGETTDRVILDRRLLREGNLIDSRSALNAARGETRTRLKSIVDIGREVGAEVVVYVEVVAFGLTRDGQNVWPVAAYDVKIFDAASNVRLFPEDGGAYRVNVPVGREPSVIGELSRSERSELELLLAQRSGAEIARMFFKTLEDTRVPDPLKGD